MIHNATFLLLAQCFRQSKVVHPNMARYTARLGEPIATARPLAAVRSKAEMDPFVSFEQFVNAKGLAAALEAAHKLAVRHDEVIPSRLSSWCHKVTPLVGTLEFTLVVMPVQVIVQSGVISPFFASVTLGAYPWSGRMGRVYVSR